MRKYLDLINVLTHRLAREKENFTMQCDVAIRDSARSRDGFIIRRAKLIDTLLGEAEIRLGVTSRISHVKI